ncbi:hypothetical protein [Paracoccus sp. (in: a-proteobacteria)]|uniref:hypothetical protein n=1 Tax=Paracoccus sp. TaxID=267 RepID=UPI002898DC11|nr:hypothetical protein [Paracoccus sp. (in: a-proteobacteria)]
MKKLVAISLGLIALTACVPVTPVVSEFNGASVKIRRHTLSSDNEEVAKSKTLAEANRICQAGGKKRAEPASTRMVADYEAEDLFLCLDK